ncbi:hypothetical protein ACSQ67_022543 [Phaseolus vulgaris]
MKGHHFELLPFGSGRRGCPSMPFAMCELPTIIGTLVRCFEWEMFGSKVKSWSMVQWLATLWVKGEWELTHKGRRRTQWPAPQDHTMLARSWGAATWHGGLCRKSQRRD